RHAGERSRPRSVETLRLLPPRPSPQRTVLRRHPRGRFPPARGVFGAEVSLKRLLDELSVMSTVQEIKAAIGQLPLEERAALIAELCGWSDDDWDRRMRADAQAGKFAALNEAAENFRDPA